MACHRAIIWTNTRILLNGPLGTTFNKILIGIQIFSFKNMHLKMFIQEYAFENVVWKMAAILSRPQYVKGRSIRVLNNHDDVMTWKCIPHYCPFMRGTLVADGLPSQRACNTVLYYYLLVSPGKLLIKPSSEGDLWRYGSDVIVVNDSDKSGVHSEVYKAPCS